MKRIALLLAPLCAAIMTVVLLAWPARAEAAVVCGVTNLTLSFGSSNTATGSIGYSCTSYDATSTSMTLCSKLGSPSWPGTVAQPKLLNGSGQLNFNVYTNAARTTVWVGSTVITGPLTIAAGATLNGSLAFYGLIPSGQGPPAGSYLAYFYGTSIAMLNGADCVENVPNVFSGNNNTLNVAATVGNNCTVSATAPLSLGTVVAIASNVASSTTLSITCPSGTPYYVGLAPSNGSSTGAGVLTGSVGNSDQPPYQLRSASASGPAWGNTATATSVGNGMSGTGTGAAQSLTVHATLPNGNYRPDTYRDTVTVNVNY